eukprot:8674407-Ditylum_brightwellii.AAC.1
MSKEGVTQGDPLAMILYALAVLPLILLLEELISDITEQLQKWFADDSALGSFFTTVKTWFGKLCEIGPPRGYIPEPEKSILVETPTNLDKAKTFFADYKFKLKEGCCYLGGFLGSEALTTMYVEDKVEEW